MILLKPGYSVPVNYDYRATGLKTTKYTDFLNSVIVFEDNVSKTTRTFKQLKESYQKSMKYDYLEALYSHSSKKLVSYILNQKQYTFISYPVDQFIRYIFKNYEFCISLVDSLSRNLPYVKSIKVLSTHTDLEYGSIRGISYDYCVSQLANCCANFYIKPEKIECLEYTNAAMMLVIIELYDFKNDISLKNFYGVDCLDNLAVARNTQFSGYEYSETDEFMRSYV